MCNYIKKLRENGYDIILVKDKLIIKIDEFNYTLLKYDEIFVNDVTGEKYPAKEIYHEYFMQKNY